MARGERIGPEYWQVLAGIGGPSSPGQRPVDEQSTRLCSDCGKALHAHDKTKVFDGNGRWSYDYECP